MSNLAKKISIDPNKELTVLYDTREILDTTSKINFFQPNPTKSKSRNNYISNPLPGNSDRLVVGLSFELWKETITKATDIDALKIMNALLFAGVRITADNDYKEFVREPIDHYMNFLGTDLETAVATAGDPASGSETTVTDRIVTVKSSGVHLVPDPFFIASNQSFDVEVTFNSADDFPTNAQWSSANQTPLYMLAKLYVAEDM